MPSRPLGILRSIRYYENKNTHPFRLERVGVVLFRFVLGEEEGMEILFFVIGDESHQLFYGECADEIATRSAVGETVEAYGGKGVL